MENTNEGTVTISLKRYADLETFEKSVRERKTVSIYYGYGGTFDVKLLNDKEENNFFLEKITQLQKDKEELRMENEKFTKKKKLSWL